MIGAWQYEGAGAIHNNAAIYHRDKTLIEGNDEHVAMLRQLEQVYDAAADGVDVPHAFEGAFTVTVGGDAAEAGFVLVRNAAKSEPPLLDPGEPARDA